MSNYFLVFYDCRRYPCPALHGFNPQSSSSWDTAVPRIGCTCGGTAFSLRQFSHQLAGKGHICCEAVKRQWAQETRDSLDFKSPTCWVSTLGAIGTPLSAVTHFHTWRDSLGPMWMAHVSAPITPAPGVWEQEERSKMKVTREDCCLNVSTTGEQIFHREPARPKAQPSVPSWLTVLSANVEPNLIYA